MIDTYGIHHIWYISLSVIQKAKSSNGNKAQIYIPLLSLLMTKVFYCYCIASSAVKLDSFDEMNLLN